MNDQENHPSYIDEDRRKEFLKKMMELYAMNKDFGSKLENIEENIDPENKELFENFKEIFNERVKSFEQKNKELPDNKLPHIDNFNKDFSKFNDISDEEKFERINRINSTFGFFNRLKNSLNKDINIDPGRLMGLTDGIFGMVITLLVFGIALPDNTITTASNFTSFLMELLPTVGVVLVSFIVVSTFWIYHHEYIRIKTLNFPFLWMNILFLASISFMPFTTSVIGQYSQFFYSEVMFGLNVFLNLILLLTMMIYASKHDLLENTSSKIEKRHTLHTFIMIMLLTMCVNLLDFFVSPNFIYLFLLIPIISTLRELRFEKFFKN